MNKCPACRFPHFPPTKILQSPISSFQYFREIMYGMVAVVCPPPSTSRGGAGQGCHGDRDPHDGADTNNPHLHGALVFRPIPILRCCTCTSHPIHSAIWFHSIRVSCILHYSKTAREKCEAMRDSTSLLNTRSLNLL